MPCLSSSVLKRVNRFLLELYATSDADAVRRLIPQGMPRLVATDHASFNELKLGPAGTPVIPTPVPKWWARLGEVYAQHQKEHPLWEATRERLNRTVSFDDRRYAETLPQSTLYNEYFLPSGTRHQLSSMIYRRGPVHVGVAVNRASRGFSETDRMVFDLISPHLGQAWKNALVLAELRNGQETPARDATGRQAVVAVDAARGAIRALSPEASGILRSHFGCDAEGGGCLPDGMRSWLRQQQDVLGAEDRGAPQPLQPLELRSRSGRLTARLARHSPGETLVLIEESAVSPEKVPAPTLTLREAEILHWLGEGKRNIEIGTILGISARTVGKHLEHIFVKLGVETRTAAVRAAADYRRPDGV